MNGYIRKALHSLVMTTGPKSASGLSRPVAALVNTDRYWWHDGFRAGQATARLGRS
jgi:hypothetical protein